MNPRDTYEIAGLCLLAASALAISLIRDWAPRDPEKPRPVVIANRATWRRPRRAHRDSIRLFHADRGERWRRVALAPRVLAARRAVPIPQDQAELARWRAFVISRWRLDHNIWIACVQAICLGMPMRRADFLSLVRDYCDQRSENKNYGRRR